MSYAHFSARIQNSMESPSFLKANGRHKNNLPLVDRRQKSRLFFRCYEGYGWEEMLLIVDISEDINFFVKIILQC
jgi:hypothetical protein